MSDSTYYNLSPAEQFTIMAKFREHRLAGYTVELTEGYEPGEFAAYRGPKRWIVADEIGTQARFLSWVDSARFVGDLVKTRLGR